MDSAVIVALVGAVPLTITAFVGLVAARRTRDAEAEKEQLKREADEEKKRVEEARHRAEQERLAAETIAADERRRADQLAGIVSFYSDALRDERAESGRQREENAHLRAELLRRPEAGS